MPLLAPPHSERSRGSTSFLSTCPALQGTRRQRELDAAGWLQCPSTSTLQNCKVLPTCRFASNGSTGGDATSAKCIFAMKEPHVSSAGLLFIGGRLPTQLHMVAVTAVKG